MLRSACSLVLGMSLFAADVLAQEQDGPEPASAERLFQEGSRLLKAGETAGACLKLAASQDQEPAIGTLGLLAYCHEQQGLLATALREYAAVAELAHAADQAAREQVARARVAELEKRVTRVLVVLSEPRAEVDVFLGERRLGAAELGTPAASDPGTYRLRALASGCEPYSMSVTVPPDGSTVRVVVPPLPLVRVHENRPAAAPRAPVAAQAPASPERGSERVAMWSGLGLGAAGVALGSYTGLAAIADNRASRPHCQGNICDPQGVSQRSRALDQARLSTVAFGAAALGLGVATYFFLKAHDQSGTPAASLVVAPSGCAFAYEGAF